MGGKEGRSEGGGLGGGLRWGEVGVEVGGTRGEQTSYVQTWTGTKKEERKWRACGGAGRVRGRTRARYCCRITCQLQGREREREKTRMADSGTTSKQSCTTYLPMHISLSPRYEEPFAFGAFTLILYLKSCSGRLLLLQEMRTYEVSFLNDISRQGMSRLVHISLSLPSLPLCTYYIVQCVCQRKLENANQVFLSTEH